MPGNVVAKAWVQIIPEMSGIQGEITKGLSGAGKSSEQAGKTSGKRFSTGFKAMVGSLGATIAAAGLSSLVQGAAESASVMSRLSASAQKNSVSADSMKAAYDGLIGVLGESDRAVETAGNMFAMCGDNQAELQTLTTALTGAFSQFGDGLPIESLAEAANETARTGVVVGGMADALNWVNASTDQWSAALGGNRAAMDAFQSAVDQGASKEDAFNAALAACSTEAERNQLVVDTLNGLYGEAGRSYEEANRSLIEYNQAQSELQGGLQSVGQSLMPAASGFMSLGATVLNSLAPAFSGVSQQVGQFAGDVSTAITDTLSDIGSGVDVATAIQANFGPIFDQAGQMLVNSITSLSQQLPTLLPMIVQAALGLFMGLVQALPQIVPPLIEGAANAITQLAGYLPQLVPLILQAAVVLFTAIVQALPQIAASLLSALAGMVAQAGSAIAGGAGQLLTFAGRMFQGLIDGASNGISDFMGKLGEIPGKIGAFFSDAGSWLLDAGASIINGLGQGISNAIGGVIGTVEDVVGQIRSFFPFSPAKRGPFKGRGYTTWSGKALMEDWGSGMESGAAKAIDFAEGAMLAVSGKLGSFGFRAAGSVVEGASSGPSVNQVFNISANDPNLVAAVVAQRQYMTVKGACS